MVQVQRTIHRSRYTDGSPAPGAAPFDIATGERSIFEQYRVAIGGARRSIYIENQYLEVPEIVESIGAALERGVEVAVLMPAHQDTAVLDNQGTVRSRTLPRGPSDAREPRQLHVGRDRRCGRRRPAQRRVRALQAHAGRRRVGDDRIVQPPQPFSVRELGDERRDLGSGLRGGSCGANCSRSTSAPTRHSSTTAPRSGTSPAWLATTDAAGKPATTCGRA